MLEIERKYLLRALPELPADTSSVHIEQGYLPIDHDPPGRLRRMRGADGAERMLLTHKRGAGLVREEIEQELDAKAFTRLWPATAGRRLVKRRWYVPVEGHADMRWEIDEFLDRALVLLEIELPDPDTVVDLPPWLSAVMIREVTDEPAFTNAALASA